MDRFRALLTRFQLSREGRSRVVPIVLSLFLLVGIPVLIALYFEPPALSNEEFPSLSQVKEFHLKLESSYQFSFFTLQKIFKDRLPKPYKKQSASLAKTLLKVCQETGIPVDLALSLIAVESSFRPESQSSVGAHGLLQVVPSTGEFWARKLGIPWLGLPTLRNPHTSIRIGLHYLSFLLKRFRGNLKNALLAYNLGPTRLRRMQGAGDRIPQFYVRRVLAELKFSALTEKL